MESSQIWNRHRIIAEEFCLYDEQVRIAESVLAEAQASRRRALAAFALTVGRDRSVADLLGLAEREVRAARRTVGKEDAQTAARELLVAAQPDIGRLDEHSPPAQFVPREQPGPPETQPGAMPRSSNLDAKLAEGWKNGVDLHVLAAETGTEVTTVVARLKELSTQGLLPFTGAPSPRGRHRRDNEHRVNEPMTSACEAPQAPPGMPTLHTDPWATWESELHGRYVPPGDFETVPLHQVEDPGATIGLRVVKSPLH